MIDVNFYYSRLIDYSCNIQEVLKELEEENVDVVVSFLDTIYTVTPMETSLKLLKEIPSEVKYALTIHPVEGFASSLEDTIAFRIFPVQHNFHKDRKLLEKVFTTAEQYEKPILITGRLKWGEPIVDLKLLADLAREFPKVKTCITGLNYGEILDIIRLFSDLNNVYLDISYFQSLNALQVLLNYLSKERVLFGTAFPLQPLEVNLLKVKMAEKDVTKILERNAKNFLSL